MKLKCVFAKKGNTIGHGIVVEVIGFDLRFAHQWCDTQKVKQIMF